MDIAEELEQVSRAGSSQSKIGQIIDGTLEPSSGDGLSDHDRSVLHELVMSPKYSTAAISQVLRGRGFEIGESSVRRYRQKYGYGTSN